MVDYVHRIASYLAVAGFSCQLVMLLLQLWTYRRTRHPSLVLLAIGSASAIVYLGIGFVASVHAANAALVWRLSLAMELLFVSQIAVSIWGSASLFRTFIASYQKTRSDMASLDGDRLRQPASSYLGRTRRYAALPQLFRLWSLRRTDGVDVLASDRLVVVLGVLSLVLWAAFDRLHAGPKPSFDPYGISSISVVVLMLLMLALALARSPKPRLAYRQALFIIVAAMPMLLVLHELIPDGTSGWLKTAAVVVLAGYAVAYLWHVLGVFCGTRQPKTAALIVALSAAFILCAQAMYLDPTLWYTPEPHQNQDATWHATMSERLLFEQSHRIDDALSHVLPSDGEQPSVFFVGFAGAGFQKVFAEEIKLAAQVVADRYESSYRQVLLINDHRDRDTYPLATVSGLRYALSGVARKMNVQRDILFLSLSSHGSEDPELVVSNGALSLEQVTGENLAQALRDSGIRYRVIVISACHAGAFIHALEDPDTVVITAAAADRTSFGCADDRDLTYFGEAFYRDALPRAHSLEEAFSLTTKAIAERETAEHITPSEPQAYFGAGIDRVLSR